MRLVVLLGVLPLSVSAVRGQHVVPLVELQREAHDNARQRQENLAKVDRFLSGGGASAAMRAVNVNRQQVQNAVALLSDSEIAALSQRTPEPKPELLQRSGLDRRRLYLAASGAAALTATLVMVFK